MIPLVVQAYPGVVETRLQTAETGLSRPLERFPGLRSQLSRLFPEVPIGMAPLISMLETLVPGAEGRFARGLTISTVPLK